jgi:uncharacterized membrane protein
VINYWPLLGIALVVVGFALRFNPLLVVAIAGIVTGLLGHMPFLKVLATLGHGFNENRYVTIIWIILPVVGLLERYGLQEQARTLIGSIRGATAGRLLVVYLAVRQILSARRRCVHWSRRWPSRRLKSSMARSTKTRRSA